jgi:hypothetical protein
MATLGHGATTRHGWRKHVSTLLLKNTVILHQSSHLEFNNVKRHRRSSSIFTPQKYLLCEKKSQTSSNVCRHFYLQRPLHIPTSCLFWNENSYLWKAKLNGVILQSCPLISQITAICDLNLLIMSLPIPFSCECVWFHLNGVKTVR